MWTCLRSRVRCLLSGTGSYHPHILALGTWQGDEERSEAKAVELLHQDGSRQHEVSPVHCATYPKIVEFTEKEHQTSGKTGIVNWRLVLVWPRCSRLFISLKYCCWILWKLLRLFHTQRESFGSSEKGVTFGCCCKNQMSWQHCTSERHFTPTRKRIICLQESLTVVDGSSVGVQL